MLTRADTADRRAAASERDLAIAEVRAFAVSVPLPKEAQITLGVGRLLKKDAVVVKVTTEGGLVGWGEAHHARSHTVIAALINDFLAPKAKGRDAGAVSALWSLMARAHMAGQGIGTAAAIAISGVDMALWDIRARAAGWPLYRLLGGEARASRAYAGGTALGWEEPARLVEEARGLAARGFTAIKLRFGDTVARDCARARAVRAALGRDIAILVDANSRYTLDDVRTVMPVLEELDIGWLEEPFGPQERRLYRLAAQTGSVPLACGENHFGLAEFRDLVQDGSVTVLQPDLSKAAGITECLRIAHLAASEGLVLHPHASMTAINAAATVHFLTAIDNGGFFEADVSVANPLRDDLVIGGPTVRADGTVVPSCEPGLGIDVDEAFLRAHPAITGTSYAL